MPHSSAKAGQVEFKIGNDFDCITLFVSEQTPISVMKDRFGISINHPAHKDPIRLSNEENYEEVVSRISEAIKLSKDNAHTFN